MGFIDYFNYKENLMATLLLVVIYIAFIGLGIPDSLFGPAWPQIYREMNLPVSLAGYVSMFSCCCSICSSLLSSRVIKRFGIGKVSAISTALTALGMLGYALSRNAVWFFALCLPLGFGAGAIDSGLNNYVAVHYNAAQMSFLHCFYGIGVTCSPFLMSLALGNGSWRGGYVSTFIIQLVITAILIAALPLWTKVDKLRGTVQTIDETPAATGEKAGKRHINGLAISCLVFIFSCSLEYLCGAWGSTFLVDAKGMAASTAAGITTLYYFGMALGRFLSGVLAAKLDSRKIITIGVSVLAAAVLLIVLPLPDFCAATGLFLVGLGNGPVYPNMVHLTPDTFGEENSQSAMGKQMASAYVGIMVMPLLFGNMTQIFGAGIFRIFAVIIYVLLAAFVIFYLRMGRKKIRITLDFGGIL